MLRQIILLISIAIALSGCGTARFNEARTRVNEVKNGMTVSEARVILGVQPTRVDDEYVIWARGSAQSYNGTDSGAIRFKLKKGRIAEIPDGGIFSPAAVAQLEQDRLNAEKTKSAKHALEVAEKERLAKLKVEKERQEAENVEREIIAELKAARESTVICKDKVSCAKAFALAQVYVSEKSDQKIQVATDTIIETYNPTEMGKIGIKVVKVPRQGTTELLTITPTCKSEKYPSIESLCRTSRTSIYSGFRRFIEENTQ